MTLARLSSELALPKSSVHGLCTTLVSFGYLRRQADGSFLIGPRVMGLAEAFVAGTDVAQEFNAFWADGGIAPEETVVLSVLSGNEALYVAVQQRAPGRSASRSTSACACRRTCPAAARRCSPSCRPTRSGAASPASLRTRLTNKGPRDIESLLKELALTRKRGYSVDDEGGARRRLLVRRAGVRCLRRGRRRGRGLHQQGAARQRSRRAPSRRRARRRAPPDASPRRRGRPARRPRRSGMSAGRRRLHPRDARAHQGVQGLRRRRQGQPARAPRQRSTR